MAEALTHDSGIVVGYTPVAALAGGEVVQLADGRAAWTPRPIEAGVLGNVEVTGRVKLAKSTPVFVKGQRVYWDVSASVATYMPTAGQQDFYCGYATDDAATGDSTVTVQLNEEPVYAIDLRRGRGTWTDEATNGLGATALIGGGVKLSFDAVAEAAQAAIISDHSVPVAKGFIVEGTIGIFDIGDDAALDISVGMANASHGTDADAITESLFLHIDGAALDIFAESDDGTTEVAATDTTKNAVDNTYFNFVMDARDPEDIQIYINGDNVLPNSVFKLDAATGPLKAIVHIEKTSNDTVADVRVRDLTVRTCEAA